MISVIVVENHKYKETEGIKLVLINTFLLQGVPRNMTVDEYFKMSSSIIF